MAADRHSSTTDRSGAASVAPLLRVERAGQRYGEREVLAEVSVTVPAGSALVVVGANGSGKSTLLRMIAGREKPATGQVLLDGRPVDEDDLATRRSIAVSGDSVACYPDLSVREHLLMVAVAHGLGRAADGAVETVLGLFPSLRSEHDSLPQALSTGQLQAVLLAAALVRPHRLVVLDEPEQRLDDETKERLAQLLNQEKHHGVGLVLATHDPLLTHEVADRVLRLHEGLVIENTAIRGGRGDR